MFRSHHFRLQAPMKDVIVEQTSVTMRDGIHTGLCAINPVSARVLMRMIEKDPAQRAKPGTVNLPISHSIYVLEEFIRLFKRASNGAFDLSLTCAKFVEEADVEPAEPWLEAAAQYQAQGFVQPTAHPVLRLPDDLYVYDEQD